MLSRNEEELHALSLQTFAGSRMFQHIFDEGMALVEETAHYLDGPGREEQRTLPRAAALIYAGESMRVTTRLMQVASWLLVQRAVQDGEMSAEDAAGARYRLASREVCLTSSKDTEQLPPSLVHLLERSELLYRRIAHLDDTLFAPGKKLSGARARMAMLQRAFGTGHA